MILTVEEGAFKGYDGCELFFQTWSKVSPRAVILGIHGLGEHSDSYKPLAKGLESTSYQLIMSDLRGHGRSSGKRGVGTVDEYIRDIKLFYEVVKERFPKTPLFFLGHSMGGLILLKFLIRHGDFGSLGCVLSSPFLGVTLKLPPLKRRSAKLLALLAPNMTLANEISYSILSHDKEITTGYEHDLWRHDRISPKLFTEMLKDIDYVFSCAGKIHLPLLMQQAGHDLVVSQVQGADLFDKLVVKNKKLIVYKDYYHEIYNEVGRQAVFADLTTWLDLQMSSVKEVSA